MKIEISPSDKSLFDLASTVYDESQLVDIARFNGSMNELNEQYTIECLRYDNGVYRTTYYGDTSIAVLLFNNSGNKLYGNIYSIKLTKTDFDSVKTGQSLEDVRMIDPDGEYLFLYTGRNDTPKVSSHYTKDGYLITIEYDVADTVISISVELI